MLTPRWIGLGLLMTLAAATMVGLGLWQLDRYHQRTDTNNRIDSATANPPIPLTQALAAPQPARPGTVGAAPAGDVTWSVVTATGRYDPAHQILARARTVNGLVGFEVVIPLVLSDGTAILVDRGWVPPAESGASTPPAIPAAPTGNVTVIGRIHAPESKASPAEAFGNSLAVRRIAPDQLAASIPHPLYGAYLTLQTQSPPADPAFVAIAPDHQDAGMNAGYVVQWWMFSLLTLAGFGYLARREAHPPSTSDPSTLDPSAPDPSAAEDALAARLP
jgi:cytochrome oxidase assembly protein ShyY1